MFEELINKHCVRARVLGGGGVQLNALNFCRHKSFILILSYVIFVSDFAFFLVGEFLSIADFRVSIVSFKLSFLRFGERSSNLASLIIDFILEPIAYLSLIFFFFCILVDSMVSLALF